MKELVIFFSGLALLVLGGGFLVSRSGEGNGPTQPIDFNHQKHTNSDLLKLECTFCHQGVTTGPAATIPKIEKCMTCHQASVTSNPEAEKVKAFSASGREPSWVRLFRLNADIIYSHKVHVGEVGLVCATCHGDVASTARFVRGFGGRGVGGMAGRQFMEFCLSCHRERGASQDCLTCHK